MKKFRELHIEGLNERFNEIISLSVSNECSNIWKCAKKEIMEFEYLTYEYFGSEYPRAIVFIGRQSGKVDNIVPVEIGQLSIEEYNKLLEDLYLNVLKNLEGKINGLHIRDLESDECDLEDIFGKESIKKLALFSKLANKGSGSADPKDRELWFDFIGSTYVEHKRPSMYYMERVLIEEFGWPGRWAEDLADEYVLITDYLEYCEKKGFKLDE